MRHSKCTASGSLHPALAVAARQRQLAVVHLHRLLDLPHLDQHVTDVAQRPELSRVVAGHVRYRQEVLLALERRVQLAEREVGQAEIAVGPTHVHLVLQVLGERQVLVVVADGLAEVADAVVRITWMCKATTKLRGFIK